MYNRIRRPVGSVGLAPLVAGFLAELTQLAMALLRGDCRTDRRHNYQLEPRCDRFLIQIGRALMRTASTEASINIAAVATLI
jgi:hypothetical protein